MGEPLVSDRHVEEHEIREALMLPDYFSSYDEKLGLTWGIGPALESRDSGYIVKANSQALLRHLNGDPTLSRDWYVQRASHWGNGWVEQIVFRVLEPSDPEEAQALTAQKEALEMRMDAGTEVHWGDVSAQKDLARLETAIAAITLCPSRVFKVLLDWQDMLEEYGTADDELTAETRREEAWCLVSNGFRRVELIDDLPSGYIDLIVAELERMDSLMDEPSGELYLSEEDYVKAVENLGFKKEDDETDPAGN